MAVTAEMLRARVGAKEATEAVTSALATAEALMTTALEKAFRPMPDGIRDECVLSVGYAVYDRAKSSDGIRQQVTMEGTTPIRSPRDPMASVRSILADYVIGLA